MNKIEMNDEIMEQVNGGHTDTYVEKHTGCGGRIIRDWWGFRARCERCGASNLDIFGEMYITTEHYTTDAY